MNNININVFATNVKDCLDKVIDNHEPVKINIDNDRECIIISAEDWKRDQETLYILQNQDLMRQINLSMETHVNHKGYCPTSEEINEILSF